MAIATASSSNRTGAFSEKVLDKGCPPNPIKQSSILISPGKPMVQVTGTPAHAWVRRYLPWPEKHLSRNITAVTWEEGLSGGLEEPRDLPVRLMTQDRETEDFSSLPHLLPKPWTYWSRQSALSSALLP